MMKNKNDYYKAIPKVDNLLREESIQELCHTFGKGLVTEALREELEELRSLIRTEEEEEICRVLEHFPEELPEKIKASLSFPLRKVWNATGIILHTNLGRAPLGKEQMNAAIGALSGYSNLEYSLEDGKRGKRWQHYAKLVCQVTGAQGAIAVNNNAAAVTLMLAGLARGKEVLVSRGELIEIGGRFRIPEVMEQSGAVLREVGTTNRTRISDYEKAVTEKTGAILKVHTSNYRIMGFTEEASVEELAELGARYQLPVLVDLGSGVLVNLERFGIMHEPTVQETLKKGADLVCFSGDKLLGGPQAGILAGRQEWITILEEHPLMRTFRLDKCTIAMLTATFREYLEENRAIRHIPVLSMLARTRESLRIQAENLCASLTEGGFPGEIAVEASVSMVGGGSLPGESIPGFAVTIKPIEMSCEQMAEKMREMPVPVIAHMKNEKIWLEMRTIPPEETEALSKELKQFFLADVCGNRTHPGRS